MMFDTSSGVEPNFALAYVKQDKDGQQYRYLNKYFQEVLNKLDLTEVQQKEIMDVVIETGSIQGIDWLPEGIRSTFVVAMDITGEGHMEMQAAFQRHVDNSISKTINFPNSATKEDVASSFVSAWKLGCKSATVYRDGSRQIQILNIGSGEIVSTTERPSEHKASQEQPNTTQRGVTPRKRPEVMAGKTYRIKTGYGNLYVTVNDDEAGVPFEVFATIGKSGGFFQEQSEAICRLASLALRSHIHVEEVVRKLKGIRGPMPVFTERGTILSLPDAIASILEEHVTTIKKVEDILERPEGQEVFAFAKEDTPSMADFGFMPGCPDCGSQLMMSEGCISCKNCGFSRCS
jgi:ribonucleoside-diphosphate reductase alpha chain